MHLKDVCYIAAIHQIYFCITVALVDEIYIQGHGVT